MSLTDGGVVGGTAPVGLSCSVFAAVRGPWLNARLRG
jgi:hypothetical protein